MDQKKINKAIVLAAGFGRRLKPITDKIPKCLVEYQGKPLISHVLSKLIESGLTEITINTHYLHHQVEKYFEENNFGIKINLVYEEEILGTGGAIKNAERYLEDSENFLVYNADVISDINLDKVFTEHINSKVLATLAVMKRETKRPLLVDADKVIRGRISRGIVYPNQASELPVKQYTFCGIHVINNRIFSLFPIDKVFDIIDFYMEILKSETLKASIIENCSWKDMGTPENIYTA